MALMTPLAKARGLGAAKEGAHHWWMQRMTAIALVPLSIWFLVALLGLLPMDYHTVVSWFASPFNALAMALFMGAMLYHAKLGLQVIIEDYLHSIALKMAIIIGIKLFMLALLTMTVLSIITLHISSYSA